MSEAPERIAFRWEVGAAITSGPLMNHPDYVHYVRADRIEELEAKLAKAVKALEGVQTFVKALAPFTHPDHTLEPTLGKALTILAELKGQNDG